MKIEYLAILLLILPSCNKIYYCGPGKTRPVKLYNKPQQRYRDIARNLEVTTKSTLDRTQSLENKLKLDNTVTIGTSVLRLQEELNQNSIRFSELIFAAASVYNQDVCSEEKAKRYFDLLDTLASYLTSISEIESKIDKFIASNNLGTVDLQKLEDDINEFMSKW